MGLRWAVSLSATEAHPHFESLFRRALQCIPSDDVMKQDRFVFRRDSLSCIISRLFMRSIAVHSLGLPWFQVEVKRDDRGKPYLVHEKFNFNISHHGDFVVCATSHKYPIGVDVMNIERDSDFEDGIRLTKRLFTNLELKQMRIFPTDLQRWTAFYRNWCLKESVLKATGIGLRKDLPELEFKVNDMEAYAPGCFIRSTVYSDCGLAQNNWLFEESFLTQDHVVAVARIISDETEMKHAKEEEPKHFSIVSLEDLLRNSTIVNPIEDAAAQQYARYITKQKTNRS